MHVFLQAKAIYCMLVQDYKMESYCLPQTFIFCLLSLKDLTKLTSWLDLKLPARLCNLHTLQLPTLQCLHPAESLESQYVLSPPRTQTARLNI